MQHRPQRKPSARRNAAHPVSTVAVDLPALDELAAEALALLFFADIRPLAGVCGLVDWRLCGLLSRLVHHQVLTGSADEVVLLPVFGRFGPRRIFLFGLGPASNFQNRAELRGCCRKVVAVMRKAGVGPIVVGAPSVGRRYPSMEAQFVELATDELGEDLHQVLVYRGP